MSNAMWQALDAELDNWREAGETATLWWRDDDAIAASDQLDRLLTIAREAEVPLCLAVIPANVEPSLVAAVETSGADLSVAVHGWTHVNHAAEEEKKSEFPQDRKPETMSIEAVQGLALMGQAFGARAVPVFVPPWNRISPALIDALPTAGYRGLSTYAAKHEADPASGLRQVNTHADIVNWRQGRTFAGSDAVLGLIVAHLAARRSGEVEAGAPTGLLTHHLIHQNDAFGFVAHLLRATAGHAAARWIGAAEAFGLS